MPSVFEIVRSRQAQRGRRFVSAIQRSHQQNEARVAQRPFVHYVRREHVRLLERRLHRRRMIVPVRPGKGLRVERAADQDRCLWKAHIGAAIRVLEEHAVFRRGNIVEAHIVLVLNADLQIVVAEGIRIPGNIRLRQNLQKLNSCGIKPRRINTVSRELCAALRRRDIRCGSFKWVKHYEFGRLCLFRASDDYRTGVEGPLWRWGQGIQIDTSVVIRHVDVAAVNYRWVELVE